MTATEARRLARDTLRLGFYRSSESAFWVPCPRCAEPVSVVRVGAERATESLLTVLERHLSEACGACTV